MAEKYCCKRREMTEEKKEKRFLKKINQKQKIKMKLPKKVNQRTANLLFLGGTLALVGLAAGTVIVTFTRQVVPNKPTVKVVEKTDNGYQTDNRLELFLNGYVSSYFNYSGEESLQKEEIERLNSYYDVIPEVRSQGQLRQPTSLISSRVQEIKKDVAVYRVTYETGAEKTRITVNFSIPYGENKTGFYVSGLPWFEAVESFKATEVDKKNALNLTATDEVVEEEQEKLDNFIKLFFNNYTTSQDNLNAVAKDVRAISGAVFKTLDYAYYKKDGKKVTAYIQATIEIAGTTHSENFKFELEEKADSFFITKMEHGIPKDYSKK